MRFTEDREHKERTRKSSKSWVDYRKLPVILRCLMQAGPNQYLGFICERIFFYYHKLQFNVFGHEYLTHDVK